MHYELYNIEMFKLCSVILDYTMYNTFLSFILYNLKLICKFYNSKYFQSMNSLIFSCIYKILKCREKT